MEGFTNAVVFSQQTAGAYGTGAKDTGDLPVRSKVLSQEEMKRRAGDVDVNACLGGGSAYNAETMHDQTHVPGDARDAVQKAKALQQQRDSK